MVHFKSQAIFKQSLQIDREAGIIRDVVIVQEGIDKDLGFFNADFINALVEHGNAQSKGVKSRFGHPNMCKTTLGTFIGRYKNFKTVTENDRLKAVADLHLDQITKKTQVEGQGISYFEYITDMAENNPDMFGNSIHFTGSYEETEKEIDGEKKWVEEYSFETLVASDLVDSPAATDELFKSDEDFGVLGTQFLDENPEIFKALEDNPNLIDDFFKRYKSYLNVKEKMNILKKVKQAVGKTKDVNLTLADGGIVTVQTDNEKPQEGDSVVDSEGKPLADGEHLLPDGGKLVTEGGKITQVVEATEEEEETSPELEQLQKEHNDLLEKHNNLQKEHNELSEAVELLADEFVTLRKSVKSKFKPHKKEDNSQVYNNQSKGSSISEKIKEQREARNSKKEKED